MARRGSFLPERAALRLGLQRRPRPDQTRTTAEDDRIRQTGVNVYDASQASAELSGYLAPRR